jgi:hypothetical protein
MGGMIILLEMMIMTILIFSVSFLAILVAFARTHLDYRTVQDEREDRQRLMADIVVAEAFENKWPELLQRFVESFYHIQGTHQIISFLQAHRYATSTIEDVNETVGLADARWVCNCYTVSPPHNHKTKIALLTQAQRKLHGRFVTSLCDSLPLLLLGIAHDSYWSQNETYPPYQPQTMPSV